MMSIDEGGKNSPLVSVVLAGGGGKRLFPLSTPESPKFFLKINSEKTLLEETLQRAKIFFDKLKKKPHIIVVCNFRHARKIKRIVRDDITVLSEPLAKNTAPAIYFACVNIEKRFGRDAVVFVMPSDHKIEKIENFLDSALKGYTAASSGFIVTFGIKPAYPETGYGYIELGEEIIHGVFKVKRFTEKPDYNTAKSYVESGKFFWNSGIFMFRVDIIMEEFKKYTDIPDIMSSYSLNKAYELFPDISIDYAICEKTDKIVCVPSDFVWSDIGSFRAIKQFFMHDSKGNAGDATFIDSENCFYISDGKRRKKIIFFGLKDIAVAESKDFILVLPLQKDQEVKKVFDEVMREKV